jgi:hypothetical protein
LHFSFSVLIEKDHAPKWRPQRLEDVDKKLLNTFFAPLEHDLNVVSSLFFKEFFETYLTFFFSGAKSNIVGKVMSATNVIVIFKFVFTRN